MVASGDWVPGHVPSVCTPTVCMYVFHLIQWNLSIKDTVGP